jgi:hypothetical protein
MKKEREKIKSTETELKEFWNDLYYEGSIAILNGESYKHIKKINTSDKSDGPSWDYIVQRESDGKLFKFNVWDAGEYNGYLIQDEYLIEVFEKPEITYE